MTMMIPSVVAQQLMKNKLDMEKARAKYKVYETHRLVSISELKKVKGFWEKTIATLIENNISDVTQIRDMGDEKALTFLTPVQLHQIKMYIKENSL